MTLTAAPQCCTLTDMANPLKDMADAYIQAAIGENTHIPLNMIFQGTGDPNKFAGVFQFQIDEAVVKRLTCGANLNKGHVLVVGDAFVRSKLVMRSEHLVGGGISSVYRSGFTPDEWVRGGKILKGGF